MIGGCGLGAWNAPYYMLDWGSVLVMAGCVLASAGLICFFVGAALVKLDGLRRDMDILRAAAAVDKAAAREPPPLLAAADADSFTRQTAPAFEPPPMTPPAAGLSTGGLSAVGLAAGGAAAGGLAVAAKSILGSVVEPRAEPSFPAEGEDGRIAAPAGDADGDAAVGDAAEAYQPMDDADRLGLDDLLERVSDGISGPRNTDEEPAETDGRSPAPAISVDDDLERPPVRDEDLFARIDEATRSLKDQSGWHRPPAETEDAEIVSVEPDREKEFARGQDDFGDLRADLATEDDASYELGHAGRVDASFVPEGGSSAAFDAPTHEQPVQVSSIHASWTQDPSSPDVSGQVSSGQVSSGQASTWQASDVMSDDAGQAEAELVDEGLWGDLGEGRPPDEPQEAPPEASAADLGEPAEDGADPENDVPTEEAEHAPEPPVAVTRVPTPSEEGIVAAYTVGDSAFAMLADGRIRVTTPDEQHLFNSMEELKAFMAARRSRINPA